MTEDNKKRIDPDTIPPPDGESDAYNAPTKVGPMSAATIASMMQATAGKAQELKERSAERAAQLVARQKQAAASEVQPNIPPPPPPPPIADVLPRVNSDDEPEDAPRADRVQMPTPVDASAAKRAQEAPIGAARITPPKAVAPESRPGQNADLLIIAIIVAAAVAAVWMLQRH